MSEQSELFPYYTQVSQPAFSAASTSYRDQHRDAVLGDADLLATGELLFLQSRARDMSRNNAVASSSQDKFVTKLGAIKVVWLTKDTDAPHDLMQELFNEFASNPLQDGYGNLDTWQATCNHERFQTGEAITRMLLEVKENSNRIPLKLQPISSEYLDINYTGTAGDKNTRYGITFSNNKPTFYNFYKERYFGLNAPLSLERVAVAAKDILHSFERKNANQWRGIPLISAALLNLYELEDLCTATVDKQKSAAAVSWIIESNNQDLLNPVGTVRNLGTKTSNDTTKKLVMNTSGGRVQYTQPGEKFNLVQNSDIGSNLLPLIKNELEKIASALNMPYYTMTGDTSGMDFSSIRAILIDWRARLEFIHTFINIPLMMQPLCNRFKQLAQLKFDVETAYPTFQLPRWYGVDDLKDAQADLLEVISGFTPISAIWAERGYSKEQIAQSMEMLKELGLEGLIASGNDPAQNNSAPDNQTTGS